MRRVADIALTLGIGVGVGILIGYLLGFTHGAPTPENSSPPPEAFDYPFGILVGVLGVVVARTVAQGGIDLQVQLRRRLRLATAVRRPLRGRLFGPVLIRRA